MTTTLGSVLTDVKARLDEAGVGRAFTSTDLRRWINEGCRDIARRAEVLQTTGTVSAVAGTNEYTTPTDVVRIYRVVFTPTGSTSQYPLEYEDFNDMDAAGWTWSNASGYPSIYTLWGFTPNLKITVYPTPSAAGTIKFWYYQYPTELATTGADDGTAISLPNGWQDLPALYAEFVALRKDADPRWQEARSLYEGALQELMDRTRRWTDQAGAMQATGRWLPGWLYNPDGW